MKYYAGIGPRTTPKDVQLVMTDIAQQLVPTGWCLRSGHANGADQAFERGTLNRQIFLPWEGYNDGRSNGKDMGCLEPSEKQWLIAEEHHSAWNELRADGTPVLTQGAKRLLARNVPIILGENLDDPVTCVITWLPSPDYQGGTTHALRIASTYGVPVFNINDRQDQTAMCRFILNVENRVAEKAMEAA